MKTNKLTNILFVTIASIILLIPVFLTNLKPDQISVSENRKLAEIVPISNGYSTFMKSLNSCANDRIGLRDEMVKIYNEVTVNVLHSRNDRVIFGKDGWLFYREDLADYTGQNNTTENVEYCVTVIKALDQWCRERGGQLVFMVGPNKSSVYSQYMPDYIQKADISLLDSLSTSLKDEDILFINPKERLVEDSDKVELYYKLDTHWNSYGAKYALDELVNLLNLPEKAFILTEHRENSGDMLSMLAVESIGSDSLYVDVVPNEMCIIEPIPDTNHKILHNDNSDNFICYRDSFSSALEGYYTHFFNGPMYWNWNVLQTPNENFPKYIIVECVERYLLRAVNSCAGVLDLQ